MKKSLLGILVAAFAAILFVVSYGGTKEVKADGEHVHCICGGTTEEKAPAHATAAYGHDNHDFTQTWEAWSSETSLPTGTGGQTSYYYLTTNVKLSGQVNITAGAIVNLCLNGHTIGVADATSSARLLIEQGNGSGAAKKLVITNCGDKADGKIIGKYNGTQGGMLWITNNAGNAMTLFNVTLDGTNSESTKIGGAVLYVDGNGTFTAYDTDILAGVASDSAGSTYGGGAICLRGGLAQLYGCSITGNTTASLNGGNLVASGSTSTAVLVDTTIADGLAKIGGNVYVSGGAVTMSGDSLISGGKAQVVSDGGHGGNCYLSTGSFTMNGGLITGGTATNIGGNNFSINDSVILTVNGGIIDGGIRLWNKDTATVNVNGGTIRTDSEGGIILQKGVVTVSGSPKINKIQLASGYKLTVGDLQDGARIRVTSTAGAAEVASGLSSDPSQYFDSFDGQYVISYNAGSLSLVSADHTHCVCAGTNSTHAHDATQVWTRWTETASLPKTAGYYYLANDVVVASATNPPDGTAVYLCLSGHTIRMKETNHSRIIQNNLTSGQTGGKKYTITNCKLQEEGRITGNWNGSSATQGGVLWTTGNATNEISVYNVIVDGSLSDCANGGAVTIENNSVFKAWKTLFIGGKTSAAGGAVNVVSGQFYAVDCEIQGGNATGAGGSLCVGGSGHAFLTNTDIHDGTSATYGGNVYVNGEFSMTGGSIKNGTSGSNGFNLRVDKTATLSGDVEVFGGQAIPSGNNVCVCSSGSLTIEGGNIGYVQSVDPSSTITINGGTVSSLGFYNGTVTINGGVITGTADASGWSGHNSTGKLYVSGGYINEVKRSGTDPTELQITGGYFKVQPSADYIQAGYYLFTDNPQTVETVTYPYEVAAGYIIGTDSRTATGSMAAAAPVSGGGLIRAGQEISLVATTPYSGYEFVEWQNDQGAQVSTNATYTFTPAEDADFTAIYSFGYATYALTVDAAAGNYTLSPAGGSYTAGTEVTATYTGTGFAGWYNEMGKLVSKDAAYTFTINADTTISAKTADASKLVVFYTRNSYVNKTMSLDDLLTANELPAVPTEHGMGAGQWNKTLAQIEAEGATADIVEVMATYPTNDGQTYTVTVINKHGDTTDTKAATAAANIAAATVITADDTYDGAAFSFFAADAAGTEILSYAKEITVRFETNTTIYAIYGVSATAEPVTVTMVSNSVTPGSGTVTIYFEALRSTAEDTTTILEQGILFTWNGCKSAVIANAAEAAANLYVGSATCNTFKSSGTQANDTTGLTMKNVPSAMTIYARGYVIYQLNDGTKGIAYSDVAVAN